MDFEDQEAQTSSDFIDPTHPESGQGGADEEGMIIGDVEEGQADIEMASSTVIDKDMMLPADSNLGKVISTINEVIRSFN